MSAPVLNRRLVLERPETVPDGAGGLMPGWATAGTLWARIEAGSGRAREENGVPLSRVPLKITVRAQPPGHPMRPVPGQRFREGERRYAILAVADADSAARYLICHAEEEGAR